MLEIIGRVALIYFAVKFLPEIAMFAVKVVVVLVGLWLALYILTWIFGLPIYYIYF